MDKTRGRGAQVVGHPCLGGPLRVGCPLNATRPCWVIGNLSGPMKADLIVSRQHPLDPIPQPPEPVLEVVELCREQHPSVQAIERARGPVTAFPWLPLRLPHCGGARCGGGTPKEAPGRARGVAEIPLAPPKPPPGPDPWRRSSSLVLLTVNRLPVGV
jgi:hypothetical protein